MNKQRKTSHILNVFQYDADGHVVLPASLTLGIVPAGDDNSAKVPSTAWVRSIVGGTVTAYTPTSRTITINGTSYDLSSNRAWSIDTGVLTATAGSGISVSTVSGNLNIVNTGLLTATAGAGISVSTVSQNLNIVNTGLLTATAGSGITVSVVGQNLNVVNTGILTATAGSGISLSVVGQNLNVVNTGILTATAGAGISLSVVNGNLNVVNTITNNNQLTNGAGYITSSALTGYATETYVGTAISNLVAAAPTTLDTLNELAAALGNDPNFATTIATSIGTKQAQLNGTGFVKVTGTTVSYDNSTYLTTSSAASTYVALAGSYANPAWITSLAWSKVTGAPAFITSYTETDTLSSVTGRGASTSTAVTFSGGATISNLLLNGAAAYTEGSLALGAHGTTEGGQLVLNKATSHTFAAHLDVWQDVFRILYGTNTATSGVAMSLNLSTRQLILPQYQSATTFTGTAAGVLAFDSSGNILTIAVPGGAVSSVSGGTGVSVNSTTGAVVVSIGQSVATNAVVTFDQVITGNNGNGTNFRIGDDVWIGDINAANTFRIQGVQNAANAYIVFGNGDATALGRAGTGALTYGGNTIYHAGNLTNLNQLTNGPGYLTGITSSQVTTALGYTPVQPNGTGASGTWGINISGTAQYFANNYIGQTDANNIWRAGSYTFFNGTNVPGGDFGLISFPTWSSTDSNSRYNIQLGANIGGSLRYRSTNINGAASWATMLSDVNFTSYAVPVRGQSNWNDSTVLDDVIGLIAWKNYGNNHVIFDASAGTSPSGGGVSQTNSTVAWTASYPTLMGWNGNTTYGVRVDSARISDNTSGNSATTSQRDFSADISTGGMGRFTGWYTGNAATGLATEVGVSGGLGYVIVYNRQTSSYGTLNLNATNIRIDPQGGTATVAGSQIVTNNGGTWGISITGNAATASAIGWANITSGTRTGHGDLRFQPPSNSFAGIQFLDTSGNGAGWFLIRGTSDTDVYTAEGITLVADKGWLTLAQRESGSKGVRIMSGITSTDRLRILTDGTIQFINGAGFTYNGNTIWHSGNFTPGNYLPLSGGTMSGQLNAVSTAGGDHGLRVGAVRGQAVGSQSGDYIMLYERVHIGYPSGWGATQASAPTYGLGVWGNIHVSQSNATGGGIILADDGDIVDLNDAWCSMRFSSGVRIYSANRGGSPVISLGSNGVISAGNITTGVNASHIVQRDANGYIYANHINFSTSESENPSISSFFTSNGDGWSRKSSLQHVRNQLGNYGGWITGLSFDGLSSKTGGTGTYQTSGDFRAPIFYDSNDTFYYVDPNSTSRVLRMQSVNLGGATLHLRSTDLHVESGSREAITFIDGSQVQAHVSTGNGCGGCCYNWWSSEDVIVDPNKDYEFHVWVRSTGNDAVYLGWGEYDSGGGTITSNPYFHTGAINTGGTWVKFTAKLKNWRTAASGGDSYGTDRYANTSNMSNDYTGTIDGVMHSFTRRVWIRLGTCYGSVNGSKTYFYGAQIREAGYDDYQQNFVIPYYNGSSWGGKLRFGLNDWGYFGIGMYGAAGEFRMSSDSGDLNLRVDGWIRSENYISGNQVYASSGWFRNQTNNTGLYNENTTMHLSSNSNGYWDVSSTTSVSSIRFYTGGHVSSLRGYVYANTSNEIGFLNSGGSWSLRLTNSGDSYTTGNAYIGRHIDAQNTWGNCGCVTLFAGWNSSKVVLGNGNNGGHDYANNLGGNSVVSTNNFYCYLDITAYSDARVKDNVETIEDPIKKVQAIRGVTFTRNDVEDKEKRHAGVIAQEVREVLPEVVSEDTNGHYSVAYGNLTSLLIEAIKEQQKQIEELQNKLDNVLSSR